MVAISSHGKHRVKRRSIRMRFVGRVKLFVKRYHASHKPVHLVVIGGIFVIEIVAVALHLEAIFHIAISSSATAWEALVITIAEE